MRSWNGRRPRGSSARSGSSRREARSPRRAGASSAPSRSSRRRSRRRGTEGTIGRVLARVGLRDGPHADLAYRLAPVAAARLADRLDDRFGDAWRDGRVEVGAGSIRVVAARPGNGVDRKTLRRSLRTLPSRVELRIVAVRPVVSTGEARSAAMRIERLLDGPRRRAVSRRRRHVDAGTPAVSRAHRARGRWPGRLARPERARRLAPGQARPLRASRHGTRRSPSAPPASASCRHGPEGPSTWIGSGDRSSRTSPPRPTWRGSRQRLRLSRPRPPSSWTSASRSRSSRRTTRAASPA